MKKLIVSVMAIATMCSFAGKTAKFIERDNTTNECDIVEWANKCQTNYCVKLALNSTEINSLDKDYVLEADEILAKKNCYSYNWEFKKCFINKINMFEKKYQPNAENIAYKYIDNETRGTLYIEYTIALNISMGNILSDLQQNILLTRIVPKAAKKCIRKQGKSFVEKDGVNPIKVYVDKVQTAMNAPKFAGMKEAMVELGIDNGLVWEIVEPLSDSEISKLKEDVLNGEKDFDSKNQNTLKVYLGLDEYNKFVKKYNDGE